MFVLRCDLYVMNMNYERNCYSYREFRYIARNYINRRIMEQERRMDYKNKRQSNLNEEESLVVSY